MARLTTQDRIELLEGVDQLPDIALVDTDVAAALVDTTPEILVKHRCVGGGFLTPIKVGRSVRYRLGDVRRLIRGEAATDGQMAGGSAR